MLYVTDHQEYDAQVSWFSTVDFRPMQVSNRESPQSLGFLGGLSQIGNYQLINIKVFAGCFVPRLVTENASASGNPSTGACLQNFSRDADISVLISKACLSRHLSEMMDRIAQGPEDVKKCEGRR